MNTTCVFRPIRNKLNVGRILVIVPITNMACPHGEKSHRSAYTLPLFPSVWREEVWWYTQRHALNVLRRGGGGGRRWAFLLPIAHSSSQFEFWKGRQQLNCHYLAFSLCLVSVAYREAAINYRTVAMCMEIGCLVLCVSGWILVCSTMPLRSGPALR